jgi:hypothetical protein
MIGGSWGAEERRQLSVQCLGSVAVAVAQPKVARRAILDSIISVNIIENSEHELTAKQVEQLHTTINNKPLNKFVSNVYRCNGPLSITS